jgi:hypothetical protein
MAAETVKFYLTDQDTNPILGVLVRVFDAAGAVFQTQDTTVDVAGDAVAEVTLDGDDPPNEYTIRLSKTGVAFDGSLGDDSKSPQLIEVYSPPANAPTGKNDFDLQGETFSLPVATDPRLCRCSGTFRDATGAVLPGLDMSFINEFKPAVVDGDGVLGSKVQLRTDADGYAQLDLYRNGEYRAMVQSIQTAEDDETGALVFDRELVIPDRSSVSLVDLLFPVVKEITWDPASVSLAAGATLDLTPTVEASDYRVLEGTACDDVLYEVEDPDIATVSIQEDKLVITGVSAGSTQLTATRKDQTIVAIPAVGITGSPLAITVT